MPALTPEWPDCDSFLRAVTTAARSAPPAFLAHSLMTVPTERSDEAAAGGACLRAGLRSVASGTGLDEAVAEFERAIALDHDSFEAHQLYGRTLPRPGKWKDSAAKSTLLSARPS